MKKLFPLFCILFSIVSYAQSPYWQQQVNYTIDVALNDNNHTLKGNLQLTYSNNSPDTLTYIWFHLWPNAYKNENTAFAQQLFQNSDGKKRWKAIKDKGFMDSLQFTINGQPATTEAHPQYNDIIKVLLPTALAPGQQVQIATPFFVKLPTYNSRSGHDGQSYMICQWYPKPAVYDRKGWHPIPYLDQGEFYSEYGNFTVSITVPAAYVVGATGVLQDRNELETYKQIGQQNRQSSNNIKYTSTATSNKTLHYTGENIHDFAWFADKDFIIEYDTLQIDGNKPIDVFAYHHPDGNKNWDKSTDYIKSAVQHYSQWIGSYPYPTVAAVEGPKNDMSGGMEYPMITLITSPTADEENLDAVITHEVGHNWFYSILGSNERDHAWMDEGINSYYQFRYEAEKYKANSIFGNKIPKEVREKPVDDFQALVYNAMNKIPMEEPIETPAAQFKGKNEYALSEYIKTAIWLYAMELSIGKNTLDEGMRHYYEQWKFKHPYPEDLKASLEETTGKGLTLIFDELNKKGNL